MASMVRCEVICQSAQVLTLSLCRPILERNNLLPDHILCIREGRCSQEKVSRQEDKLAFSIELHLPEFMQPPQGLETGDIDLSS